MAVATPPIRLPIGVRDFLPRAAARRRALTEQLLATFAAWGFERIVTPAFECDDVLALGLGEAARAATVRFVEPVSGEVVALRPDLTPQVARLVATRLPPSGVPLRLCYDGAVTRVVADRGPREVLQAGIELIDAEPAAGDAELVAMAACALGALPLAEPHLELGHVAPIQHVLAQFAEPVRATAWTALARGDARALAGLAAALPPAARALALALPTLRGPARDVLGAAMQLAWPADVQAALSGLAETLAGARTLLGAAAMPTVRIDLAEVRGFDYYTGLRIAGYARGAADAVLRGGRYDDLIARYGSRRRAVGFAVDVEACAEATPAPVDPATEVVLVIDADPARAAAVARALRVAGVRASLAPVAAAAGIDARLAPGGYRGALVVRPGGRIEWLVAGGATQVVPREAYDAAAGGAIDALLDATRA